MQNCYIIKTFGNKIKWIFFNYLMILDTYQPVWIIFDPYIILIVIISLLPVIILVFLEFLVWVNFLELNLFAADCCLFFYFVPGTDQSQAQLLGPDCQILGFAGMCPEDPACGAEDFGFI